MLSVVRTQCRPALHSFKHKNQRTIIGNQPRYKRNFSLIQSACDGFLDLAVALPFPPSVPAYAATVIFVTGFSRLALLPFSIWAKKRQWRAEEVVMPHIEKLKPILTKTVLKEMQLAKVTGTADELRSAHAKRVRDLLTKRRDQLLKEHHCRPLPTVLIHTLSQLPVFVLISTVLAQLSVSPTPFDSEAFFTLTSLAHTDATNTLPIILGIVTMANVESSRWFMTQEQKDREKMVDEWSREKRAKGETVVEPKKHMQSGMRALAVGRIILGTLIPGSVVIYWVSSSVFGLFQTWVFDWWEVSRKRRLRGGT